MRRKILGHEILDQDQALGIWRVIKVYTDRHAFNEGELLELGFVTSRPGESPATTLSRELPDYPLANLFAVDPLS